jgi:hypothetical protein
MEAKLISTSIRDGNVVTAVWSGDLSAEEVDALCGRLDLVAATHGAARLLVELADVADVEPAAAWEDLKVIEGVAHLERLALVTDEHWVAIAARVDNTVVPAEIEVFDTADRNRALAWVTRGSAGDRVVS